MERVQPFHREMIEKALTANSWKYRLKDDGNFEVTMSYDEKSGVNSIATLEFGTEGEKGEIFTLAIYPNKKIHKSDWGRALLMCNQWNREYRWPKAYLLNPENSTDTIGYISLEWQANFEKGIHQEFMNFFVLQIVGAGIGFCEWSYNEHGFQCSVGE